MSDENTTPNTDAREILDLGADAAESVRGGKKGSFDITEIAGDPSQWGVDSASLNFAKIEYL